MANRNFIPQTPTIMEAFIDELAARPSDDGTGVADDHRCVLLGGRMVILCGYSVGLKYGDYSEDQYDEADNAPRRVSKGDRIRKVEKRAFTKRGCIRSKKGLSF